MLDVSLSGCAVATDQPLEEGTVVRLLTRFEGHEYQDTLCALRSVSRPGASSRYTVAGRFAWGNPLGATSVRGAIPVPLVR